MRFFWFLSILILLSCSCLSKNQLQEPLPESTFPDKKLEEIVISGRYGKEQFHYSEVRYCYNKTDNKEDVFNSDLKVRLYDKEGKMLSEDFLRSESDDNLSRSVTAYLSYHDEGHEIRIVKLNGNKEILLDTLGFAPQSELIKITYPENTLNHFDRNVIFDEEEQCHVGPGPM